jgi:hypothetical protein
MSKVTVLSHITSFPRPSIHIDGCYSRRIRFALKREAREVQYYLDQRLKHEIYILVQSVHINLNLSSRHNASCIYMTPNAVPYHPASSLSWGLASKQTNTQTPHHIPKSMNRSLEGQTKHIAILPLVEFEHTISKCLSLTDPAHSKRNQARSVHPVSARSLPTAPTSSETGLSPHLLCLLFHHFFRPV